jgi:hypothetical protein
VVHLEGALRLEAPHGEVLEGDLLVERRLLLEELAELAMERMLMGLVEEVPCWELRILPSAVQRRVASQELVHIDSKAVRQTMEVGMEMLLALLAAGLGVRSRSAVEEHNCLLVEEMHTGWWLRVVVVQ